MGRWKVRDGVKIDENCSQTAAGNVAAFFLSLRKNYLPT